MGRPLNKRHFGAANLPGKQVTGTAWIPGESSAEEVIVIQQKTTQKYEVVSVNDENIRGFVTTANTDTPLEGEFSIPIDPNDGTGNSTGVEYVRQINSRQVKTFDGNTYAWAELLDSEIGIGGAARFLMTVGTFNTGGGLYHGFSTSNLGPPFGSIDNNDVDGETLIGLTHTEGLLTGTRAVQATLNEGRDFTGYQLVVELYGEEYLLDYATLLAPDNEVFQSPPLPNADLQNALIADLGNIIPVKIKLRLA